LGCLVFAESNLTQGRSGRLPVSQSGQTLARMFDLEKLIWTRVILS